MVEIDFFPPTQDQGGVQQKTFHVVKCTPNHMSFHLKNDNLQKQHDIHVFVKITQVQAYNFPP